MCSEVPERAGRSRQKPLKAARGRRKLSGSQHENRQPPAESFFRRLPGLPPLAPLPFKNLKPQQTTHDHNRVTDIVSTTAYNGCNAGKNGRRMRAFNWEATDFGPPENWPGKLRVAVSICLSCRFPMVLFWGPKFNELYNDRAQAPPGTRPAGDRMLARVMARDWTPSTDRQ
jgi:hypothetical protein